jgi:hypothetical protein
LGERDVGRKNWWAKELVSQRTGGPKNWWAKELLGPAGSDQFVKIWEDFISSGV